MGLMTARNLHQIRRAVTPDNKNVTVDGKVFPIAATNI
jgi:hypothetical protein